MKNFLIKILRWKLQVLSAIMIKRFLPFIIAITGSAGKTSSKEAIYSVLKEFKRCRRSLANFNNELGVPLTILGNYKKIYKPISVFWIFVVFCSIFKIIFGRKKTYPEVLILEYGADAPGDISELLKIAKPNIAVITAIGKMPVHVENYPGGIDAVAKEKGKLTQGLKVLDLAVLNCDDEQVFRFTQKTRARIFCYGFSENATFIISEFNHIFSDGKLEGVAFKIENLGSVIPVSINGAFSMSHSYAVASAAAVAKNFNINLVEISEAILKNYKPVSGRSVVLDGIKGSQIIDESYNSSPIALEMALNSLKKISQKRKIAVLGDMLELGDFTVAAHEMIGKLVPSCVDVLITVGARANFIADQAIKSGMSEGNVFIFDNVKDAGDKLQEIIKEGDLALIKGSRAIGLEKIIEEVVEL